MSTIRGASRSLSPFRATVLDAPVSYSVYSAFSFYASRRSRELPGPWLVAALGALGHETGAIRQTLYRMEASRELLSRAAGRVKHYRLSPYATAEAEAGLEKIMRKAPGPWDGQWTLVQFRPGTEGRLERERFREIARVEGFGSAGAGLLVHPRDRSARLLAAAQELGLRDVLDVFRGRRVGGESDREFVARHWRLDDLAQRYHALLEKYRWSATRRLARTSEEAFVMRFAVVFDYLETAWDDPDLPPALLPRGWPGIEARSLARRLYRAFLPGALTFGDAVMARLRSAPREASYVA
jgi:phenylacetic acid degradation operon negative regulatory protein